MDFLSALQISASGLSVQRTRLQVATANLANAESTRGPDGLPYRRRDPVVEAVSFDSFMPGTTGTGAPAARIASIIEDKSPGKRVYSPGHPDSDGDGFVTLPNVNPIHEVVNLMSASRGFEANASAVETLKTMAQRALDIAR